jgi:hypothetical protein
MSASMDTLAYRQAENESQSQTGFQRTECTSECPGDFEDGKFTRTYTGMVTVSGSITMYASFFFCTSGPILAQVYRIPFVCKRACASAKAQIK